MQEYKLTDKTNPSPASKPGSSDKLSVAYFTPGWPPAARSNGIVTYVASMAEVMRDLGHRPYVLSYDFYFSEGSSPDCEAMIHLSSRRRSNEIAGRLFDATIAWICSEVGSLAASARGLRQSAETLFTGPGLDLLEIEESFGLNRFLRGRVPVPVVVRLHGPWFLNGAAAGSSQDGQFARRVRYERQGIAQAFAISAPSQDVLEQTRRYYNLPLERAAVIPCPIACTPREQRWQSQTCEPDVIAFIGRFDRHKGGDLLIDAFAQVLREFPNIRLLFAGPDTGYVDDDGRVWQLEAYVRERIPGALATGQIEWLGQQPPQVVRELRRRAQLTVVASRYDNCPYTVLEALSLGCPIVGARVGGIPEIITDGVSGLLFQAGNAADLAAQIIRLLKNPNLAAQLGHQAGEVCAQRFSPEVVARQSIDFYRKTLELWSKSKTG